MENESRDALVAAFGEEVGKKLFGVAVKLSATHNVDLDDVVQDLSIEALAVKESYGFVHINTVALRTKNALYDGHSGARYGGNRYQSSQGRGEICLTDMGDDSDIEFADEVRWDLAERFQDTLDALEDDEKAVAYGIMAGYSQTEIAEKLGKSSAYVSIRKRRLQESFGWAVA